MPLKSLVDHMSRAGTGGGWVSAPAATAARAPITGRNHKKSRCAIAHIAFRPARKLEWPYGSK
jgi:hypothetical protein